MVYDAFILSLAIIGIVGVLVFSHKIAYSRVYPIGIVRKWPESRKSIDDTRTQPDTQVAGPPEQPVLAPPLEADLVAGTEVWRCEKCGLVQHRGKDFRCRRCKQLSNMAAKMRSGDKEDPRTNEGGRLPLDKQVAEHGKTLELHDKLFEQFETRIRQLEVESVQKSQETGEQSQPAREEYIH